jgi:hypothetical protein
MVRLLNLVSSLNWPAQRHRDEEPTDQASPRLRNEYEPHKVST